MNSIEVLLIEDNIYDAELAIRELRKNHLANTIVHIEDGSEALDYIFCRGKYVTRNGEAPNLILLDLNLPKVSGIELLREIKAHPETQTIPVIVMASSRLDPDIDTCYKLGANSYVPKPIDLENFVKSVSEVGVYWLLVKKEKSPPPS